jgi:excinuclease ABC subunit B
MYADKITPSMEAAIDETNRRRAKQVAYNTANGVDPQPLRKKIADITDMLAREDESTQALLETWQHQDPKNRKAPVPALSRLAGGEAGQHSKDLAGLPSAELAQLIQELTDQMKGAAAELHFEVAARLRDEIGDLKKELRQMMAAGVE